jgi:predicted MFS family arabinose efflux permease
VKRESAFFYLVAIGAAASGTLIGKLVGWEGDALFAAGMAPLAAVMLIFILKEPRDGPEAHRPVRSRERST